MYKIKVENINYQVSGQSILDDISFKINSGEKFALLGHNGSGKTSMVNILIDIIKDKTGIINFEGGKSFDEIKDNTGIVWDNLNIFPLLKVREAVKYIGNLYNLNPKSYKFAFNLLEIQPIQGKYMQKLSQGERKRVEILFSIMHSPKLLIMDEPTAQLDPLIREKVWNKIFLRSETIFFTTHLWEEAKKYATSIGLLYNGKLLNKPASYKKLLKSFKFSNKIITTKDIGLNGIKDTFLYENEESKVILVKTEDDPLINHVRKNTVNYSIVPVDLIDIYRYLIETNQ